MSIPHGKIPAFVRQSYDRARKAFKDQRDAEVERLKFYVGGDLQWRETELTKRRNQQRPWITINRCKPAVDQIEGDIRMNPPGPQCHPVGSGADKDTADIHEGLIREIEYRSGAQEAYSLAGRHEAASGYGCLELVTEYAGERTFAQRCRINPIEDPGSIYFDPSSRELHRRDAGWAVKVDIFTRLDYIAAFGEKNAKGAMRRVLEPKIVQQVQGWIQEAIGYEGGAAQVNEWTGHGDGPFFVATMYYVDTEETKLRLYSDNVERFDDESVPKGVKAKDGEENVRVVPRRKIRKWVCDALELIEETDWLGEMIPWFPVLGPEMWIDGKLHRLSLISPAIDPQRGLNYAATTAVEIGGTSSKAPWIGWKGQFDDPRWQTANSEMWAYMEVTPAYGVDSTTGQQTLLPAPQRNTWEAPIQWLLALSTYFSEAIKAVTAIYDASLGKDKSSQSGVAISQLRSESNVGNFSYTDNLHNTISLIYQEIVRINKQILDGPRAVTIVKPDSQHEIQEINQMFHEGLDPKTGKKGKSNDITQGEYSVRVTAGPSFQTRQEKAIATLTDFFKVNPTALATPGVAAKFLRMIGEGNPQVEGMADLLMPGSGEEQDPSQMAQQMGQLQQQNQAQTVVIQKMQQALAAKMPEIDAKKWIASLNALAGIREAEIKAGVDQAALDVRTLEHITGLAHDTAMQAVDQQHAATMQQAQGEQAQQSQQSEHDHAASMAAQAAENQPEVEEKA